MRQQLLAALPRAGNRTQPPRFTPIFDALAYARIGERKEFYLLFREKELQKLIRRKREVHPLRVGTNENKVRLENQVHGVDANAVFFAGRQQRLRLGRAFGIEPIDEPLPLPGVNRRGLCVEHAEVWKNRSNVGGLRRDRKSTRLNSSHANISYAVFCL